MELKEFTVEITDQVRRTKKWKVQAESKEQAREKFKAEEIWASKPDSVFDKVYDSDLEIY